MMKRNYYLEGLGCANCAAKIEADLNKNNNLEASIDFLTKKLSIKSVADYSEADLSQLINKSVHTFEPDVKVQLLDHSKKNQQISDKTVNENLIRVGVSGLLLLATFLFKITDPLATIVLLTSYLFAGLPVIQNAFKNMRAGNFFSEYFLMSIATIGAIVIGELAEAVSVMLFYLVGQIFQDIAVDKSKRTISDLMDIRPDYAHKIVSGKLVKVHPDEVSIGEEVIIKPGERVPLDGKIVAGSSYIDSSSLTGESLPIQVSPGDIILSGSINQESSIKVQVEKEFSESTASKIIDLVENASQNKAETEQFITKFSRYYTPIVVFLALIIAIVPPLLARGQWVAWLYRSLVFLVVSCPCALVISIPLGFFGGIGGASRRGILVKGSNFLEALNNVKTIIFDKTGTLTYGKFEVVAIEPIESINQDELLRMAAYGEVHSSHPIAQSIKHKYGQEIDHDLIAEFQDIPGKGTQIKLDKDEIYVGNHHLMEMAQIEYPTITENGTIVYIAKNQQFIGYLVIADQIKEEATQVMKTLHDDTQIEQIIMLTGDRQAVATKVGQKLNIDQIYYELLPQDKVDIVEKIVENNQAKGYTIFVGDGMNDAPVLARADIGISMGMIGSDAAIEASDIVLMEDKLTQIPLALKIARKTRTIVLQNIAIALGVKFCVMALAAIGYASMWGAVFADVGVALIAIINATRALKTENID